MAHYRSVSAVLIGLLLFPAGFAALSNIGPPQFRNVAVSLTVGVAFLLGGGAIPAGMGILGEEGLFSVGVMLVGGLLVGSIILVQHLKFREDGIEEGG